MSLLHRTAQGLKRIFMKKRVRLFIAGQEVEFNAEPDILYNFRADDLTSPSAIQNTFSKSIDIPGTRRNNRIFDEFFHADYFGDFDPSKKIDFTIYLDSEPYEKGYAKLDKIKQDKHSIIYSVSLFGGLGEFFYALDSDENGKRKLSSLRYYEGLLPEDEPLDLSFEVSKDTLTDAWANIYSYSGKWGCINFTPAYEGYPDSLDADKVLLNFNDTSGTTKLISSVVSGSTAYTTDNGYALAELKKQYTAEEMREYRSYLQRPVINVRHIIEAIVRPENNGGFEVVLDEDFFNAQNPYYWDAWLTLPRLSEIKMGVDSTDYTQYDNHAISGTTIATFNNYDKEYVMAFTPEIAASASKVEITFDLTVTASTEHHSSLYTSAEVGGERNFSCWAIQLIGYAGTSLNSAVVARSNVAWLTSKRGNDYLRPDETFADSAFGGEPAYDFYFGEFEYSGVEGANYRYTFNRTVTLSADLPSNARMYALYVMPLANLTETTSRGKTSQTYGLRRRRTYTGTTLDSIVEGVNTIGTNNNNQAISGTAKSYTSIETAGYTGALLNQKLLLNTDFTPYQFLVGYCKQFGLYFVKDPIRKKINILTRKNFFRRTEIVDITKLIDRSGVETTPLVFDKKFYEWSLEPVPSQYGQQYEAANGIEYGAYRKNTGYEFNTDVEKVLDGNVLKASASVVERSQDYFVVGDDIDRPFMFDGFKYNLFKENDASGTTYEVDVKRAILLNSSVLGDKKYYWLYDMPEFHTAENSPSDGAYTLLFLNGYKDLVGQDGTPLKFFATDDMRAMLYLGGNSCWLYTNSEYDIMGNKIANRVYQVPYFSRYIIKGNGQITKSWDFGTPEEVYIPGTNYRSGSTICSFFWEPYESEVLSPLTRKVVAKMRIKELPSVDWLRRFYMVDGALFRMTSINDYNVGGNGLTEVELVKVRDIDKYTSTTPDDIETITLSLSQYTIGASGGTVQYNIVMEEGGPWYIEYSDDTQASQDSGVGDYTGNWTIGPNNGYEPRRLYMYGFADASASVYLVQSGVTASITKIGYGNVDATGGTVQFLVNSPDMNWTAGTEYTGIATAFSPTGGTAATGATLDVTVSQNTTSSMRDFSVWIQLENGSKYYCYLRQNAAGNPFINLRPDYISVPASGGTYVVQVEANVDWEAHNDDPEICEIQTTAGTEYWMSVAVVVHPNTTGSSRYASIPFYKLGYLGQTLASYAVSQDG